MINLGYKQGEFGCFTVYRILLYCEGPLPEGILNGGYHWDTECSGVFFDPFAN